LFDRGFRGRDVIDLLLKPLEGLADTFADLRKFSRPKNDQHNDQDDNHFGKSHGAKHVRCPSSAIRNHPRDGEP
jgi:hypothetical protein